MYKCLVQNWVTRDSDRSYLDYRTEFDKEFCNVPIEVDGWAELYSNAETKTARSNIWDAFASIMLMRNR